jgi:hypothetical protein
MQIEVDEGDVLMLRTVLPLVYRKNSHDPAWERAQRLLKQINEVLAAAVG